MKQASVLFTVQGGGSGAKALDHPLPTGRVVYEMPMVVARQERHFEPSVRRVLGTSKKPKAESADRESPSRSVVAAPMTEEPGEDEGDQPDATNPNKIVPHRNDRLAGKVQGSLEARANKDPLRVLLAQMAYPASHILT